MESIRVRGLMTLGGKRIVEFAEDGYEDLELWVPYYRLIEEGAEVVLAGHEKRTYNSKHSYPCEVDAAAADLRPKDFDAVVIPGGVAGPDKMRRHKEILDFVRAIDDAGKVVAAICHAAWSTRARSGSTRSAWSTAISSRPGSPTICPRSAARSSPCCRSERGRMVRAPRDWRAILGRAETLVRRHDRAALEILLPALSWRHLTAQKKAVALLVRLGPSAVPALINTLERGRTATERRGAAEALGQIGDSQAVPRLVRALTDSGMSVRQQAMVGLLRLEAMTAVPHIIRRLQDESGGVRVVAAGVLGKFGDPRALPALIASLDDAAWIASLDDAAWYVRQAAATALGEIGDRTAMPALERATHDARKSVARAAKTALRAIRS